MQEEKSTGRPAAVERRKDRSGLGESPTVVRMRNAPQRGGLLEIAKKCTPLIAKTHSKLAYLESFCHLR